jgi:carboxymethylenebutenolidase
MDFAIPEAGSGPGLLMIGADQAMADFYAEEGYVTLNIPAHADIDAALGRLRARPETIGGIGALGIGSGASVAYRQAQQEAVAVAVGYDPVGIVSLAGTGSPMTLHIAGETKLSSGGKEIFVYPGVKPGFHKKANPEYDKPAASMAHTRSIAALRRAIGPNYDLAALWEEHCYYEFGMRDVPRTMATMTAEPYVNHVPTMTGGVGQAQLARFYRNHFVNSNPKDTRLVPVSRTIGADRLVDEMLFCFTHDVEIDWMLPGVKPTGRCVEVPLIAIINFRGPKLYHEHIYWDQASVLVQIGLLDPRLLPVAGVETARKLIDETQPSNTLMARWAESEGK